jgi:hypothetical protein
MSRENLERAIKLYREWKRGEISPGLSAELSKCLFDPLIPADAPDWQRQEIWEPHQVEGERFIEAGEHVVVDVYVRAQGKHSGSDIESRHFCVLSFEDGKLARVSQYKSRAEVLEAVGLREEDES